MEFKLGVHHPKASETDYKITLNKLILSPISWYTYYGTLQLYLCCQIIWAGCWVFLHSKRPHLPSKYEAKSMPYFYRVSTHYLPSIPRFHWFIWETTMPSIWTNSGTRYQV